MSIQDELELNSLKAVGRIVRQVLDAMKAEVRPGVSTRYLDEVGGQVMQANGAHSAPSKGYKASLASASCAKATASSSTSRSRKMATWRMPPLQFQWAESARRRRV